MNNQRMLEGLIELRRRVFVGEHKKQQGICLNLCRIIGSSRCVDWLDPHFVLWDEYSGDECYPVKAYTYTTPCEEYEECSDMWVGEYGAARKRLLDFLITHYTGLIDNENI